MLAKESSSVANIAERQQQKFNMLGIKKLILLQGQLNKLKYTLNIMKIQP